LVTSPPALTGKLAPAVVTLKRPSSRTVSTVFPFSSRTSSHWVQSCTPVAQSTPAAVISVNVSPTANVARDASSVIVITSLV